MTITYRPISPADDAALARIVRDNLRAHALDVPGTAYFDPELDDLSAFYGAEPERRAYFVAADEQGRTLGGAGLAEFPQIPDCAEVQKLYLTDEAKGRGVGRALMQLVEAQARQLGYRKLYLETHSNLKIALHLYETAGYAQIDRPSWVFHSTMDRFFIKEL